MKQKFKHLPKDQRKKILLICDDIRVHSGVATVAKEIVIHTSHHFNWVQMGGAIKHPDKGKVFDLSPEVDKQINIKDSYVRLYPQDGYGTPDILREIIKMEKPDAIMLFTDPRYFTWVFNMEQEIRKSIPITYLNIWDDYPAPMYNRPYYEACDLLMGISKQTVNINKLVLKGREKNRLFKYLPHGLNPEIYSPLDKKDKGLIEFQKSIFPKGKPKFTLFFNSRNIRRKQIPDSLLAYRAFLDSLPLEEALQCKFILHTELLTEAGTDLSVVHEYLFGEKYNDCVVFSTAKLTTQQLNYLYNSADAQILLTSNEGWGLSITEALLSGTPFIANVTGGMQDQMRFVDENGNWYTNSKEIPSNQFGTYKEHGIWALPVFPKAIGMVGSPQTPYIWDSRCDFREAKDRICQLHAMTPSERQRKGNAGREWALSDEAGFTAKHMGNRFIGGMEKLFSTWMPRENFTFWKDTDYKSRKLNHKLEY